MRRRTPHSQSPGFWRKRINEGDRPDWGLALGGHDRPVVTCDTLPEKPPVAADGFESRLSAAVARPADEAHNVLLGWY